MRDGIWSLSNPLVLKNLLEGCTNRLNSEDKGIFISRDIHKEKKQIQSTRSLAVITYQIYDC